MNIDLDIGEVVTIKSVECTILAYGNGQIVVRVPQGVNIVPAAVHRMLKTFKADKAEAPP